MTPRTFFTFLILTHSLYGCAFAKDGESAHEALKVHGSDPPRYGGVHFTAPRRFIPDEPNEISPHVQLIDPRECIDRCAPNDDGFIRIKGHAFRDLKLDRKHAKCEEFWPEFNDEFIAPLDPERGCSGTVTEIGGRRMILTAAHCLDENAVPEDGWLAIFGRHADASWHEGKDHEVLVAAARTTRVSTVHACEQINDNYNVNYNDWALLPISDDIDVEPIALRQAPLQVPTSLYAISHPFGLPLAKTVAASLAAIPAKELYLRIEISNAIGGSGGGIFDEQGHLAGVISGDSPSARDNRGCSQLQSKKTTSFTPVTRILEALETDSLPHADCPPSNPN